MYYTYMLSCADHALCYIMYVYHYKQVMYIERAFFDCVHIRKMFTHTHIYICILWQLINIPVSAKRHLREKKSFFRESFATPSPRPFVCSVRSGAIAAAAVVLANTVAAVHLRAVRSVKCRQSPSFALVTCGCRRCAEPCNKLPGLSPVFRGSFAKLSPKLPSQRY